MNLSDNGLLVSPNASFVPSPCFQSVLPPLGTCTKNIPKKRTDGQSTEHQKPHSFYLTSLQNNCIARSKSAAALFNAPLHSVSNLRPNNSK
mmetsp:Transcript_18665/g.34636  ORF Transcript_18665/g.34636 Transcript_18665/m.34636 type:complete len:91 (-) Transcript_18665:901-1173(-)